MIEIDWLSTFLIALEETPDGLMLYCNISTNLLLCGHSIFQREARHVKHTPCAYLCRSSQ